MEALAVSEPLISAGEYYGLKGLNEVRVEVLSSLTDEAWFLEWEKNPAALDSSLEWANPLATVGERPLVQLLIQFQGPVFDPFHVYRVLAEISGEHVQIFHLITGPQAYPELSAA